MYSKDGKIYKKVNSIYVTCAYVQGKTVLDICMHTGPFQNLNSKTIKIIKPAQKFNVDRAATLLSQHKSTYKILKTRIITLHTNFAHPLMKNQGK